MEAQEENGIAPTSDSSPNSNALIDNNIMSNTNEKDVMTIEETSFPEGKIILGTYDEAPDHLKDNEYLHKGYLLNCNSLSKVLRSLFVCHNETINVWSHLLGAIGVIGLVIYTAICINANKEQLNSYIDIDEMITQIKDVTNPWLFSLSNDKKEGDDAQYEITIESLIQSTTIFLNQINDHYDIISKVNEYILQMKDIIYKAKEYIGGSVVIDEIVIQWSSVKNGLISILGIDNSYNNDDKNMIVNNTDGLTNNLGRWPLFVMLCSAFLCLSFSAVFHWIKAYSKSAGSILSRLDYAGITILIAGSTYPPYFYFFYCEILWQSIYLAFITIFAFGVFCYSLTPNFYQPHLRKLRGTLFLTLGISTAIPIFHLAFFNSSISGFTVIPRLIFWPIGGASYIIGALIYINRFPEKCRPGKHDLFGASHQIFHVLVVVGVIMHYIGSLDSYWYRINNTCPIKP